MTLKKKFTKLINYSVFGNITENAGKRRNCLLLIKKKKAMLGIIPILSE